ncbi:MAG: glutamate-5-semialdehyde dehydrogenase [Bacteroidales bacterium]|jgi:glutamate-5-semialdehyde dehydrogenase|nr:glutamate-5-semialdehyde dehydrogenase [Bacteroidales bacterium]
MDCIPLFAKAGEAGARLRNTDDRTITDILLSVADAAELQSEYILAENRKDLAVMDKSDPRYDRLMLSPARIRTISSDIRVVASFPSPCGKILYEYRKPDGLLVKRISVPFGVIGIIYEARPNVTIDVFSLCFRSGNSVVLKGGTDAVHSNTAITKVVKDVLKRHGMNEDVITLLPPGREETRQMMNARGCIDLLIPRGSRELIDFVRENARIPFIETGAGVCHVYFDETGDSKKGRDIILNAKTRRVSVCNALDCLIIHRSRLKDLPELIKPCAPAGVVVYADKDAYNALSGKYPRELLCEATPASFGTEFLSYKMAVRTASTFSEALMHISEYGSGHSEAIVSEEPSRLGDFCRIVDAAAVYTNASTAFTDGAEFGLGAEIGISTQKLHARGPMALEALTTSKWIIEGSGHTRP